MTAIPLSLTRAAMAHDDRHDDRHDDGVPDVDIAIPVHNEAAQLAASVASLRAHLDERFPFEAVITIVDNASTDGTLPIALELSAIVPGVRVIHLDAKGRGRALRAAWTSSSSPVVAYMDVDLSTGLDALLPLIAPLMTGQSEVAVGTRRAPGSVVTRGARRELLSRTYNLLLRAALASPTGDAQCGFKALRRETARELLPYVEDEEWFFDTELLVTADRFGRRVLEVPVTWVDDLDSRVEVVPTAIADLRGIWRLVRAGGWRRPRGVPSPEVPTARLWALSGIGLRRPLAVGALFGLLAPLLGPIPAVVGAGVLCDATALAGFGELGRPPNRPAAKRQVATVSTVVGTGLAVTVAALFGARVLGITSLVAGACVVALAEFAASVVRFAVLRTWVMPGRYRGDPTGARDQKARPTAEAGWTPSDGAGR